MNTGNNSGNHDEKRPMQELIRIRNKARLVRDKKRRERVKEDYKKRLILKKIYYDERNPLYIREYALIALENMGKDSSYVRIKNRCLLTGRRRSVSRLTKLSRIKLRELALSGYLPGFEKY